MSTALAVLCFRPRQFIPSLPGKGREKRIHRRPGRIRCQLLIMAADTIYMPKNATMMVHNPMALVIGNAKDLRREADALDKIRVGMIEAYLAHAGDKLSEEKLKELLDAETWLTAEESYSYGFVDELIDAKEIAACVDMDLFSVYRNTPKSLLEERKGSVNLEEEARLRSKIAAESEATIETVGKILR